MRIPLVAFVCVAACASSPSTPGTPSENTTIPVAPQMTIDIRRDRQVKSTELAASRERVWTALMAAHETLAIPLEAVDEKAGTAIYRWQNSSRPIVGKRISAYLDCGTGSAGPRAETHRVNMKVTELILSSTSERTSLQTMLTATARDNGLSNTTIECSSTGVLEAKILELVAVRLSYGKE